MRRPDSAPTPLPPSALAAIEGRANATTAEKVIEWLDMGAVDGEGILLPADVCADFAAVVRRLTAEGERLRETIRELVQFGGQLSNCAFNLAQRDELPADVRETLRECCRLWDAANERRIAALTPTGDADATH